MDKAENKKCGSGSKPCLLPAGVGEMVDPKTGIREPTGDVRDEFSRISKGVGRDPEAERAFVRHKIEVVRSHPTLSNEEKASAIAELKRMLRKSES